MVISDDCEEWSEDKNVFREFLPLFDCDSQTRRRCRRKCWALLEKMLKKKNDCYLALNCHRAMGEIRNIQMFSAAVAIDVHSQAPRLCFSALGTIA